MNNKKLLVLIILAIFCVGMVMGTVSASHTFKDKGFKYTMSTKKVNKLKKKAKTNGYGYAVEEHYVNKYKNLHFTTKLKVGKSYQFSNGQTYKVVKFIKKERYNGQTTYKFKIKQTAKIWCEIDYYNGKYSYSAMAFPAKSYW